MDATGHNRGLTAVNAVLLLILLAAEGVTILSIRSLFTWHVVIGMLLVPPILLKLSSTGWRFARYYLRHPAYVEAGPPAMLLRATAPLVVLSTLAVFGTGVAMAILGPSSHGLIGIHKASFIVWLAATGVHVLGHILRLPALARRAQRPQFVAVLASLVAGVAIAGASVPLAHNWTSWISTHHHHEQGGG